MCVCVCVCVRERERERERVFGCVFCSFCCCFCVFIWRGFVDICVSELYIFFVLGAVAATAAVVLFTTALH